jgi:nitrogen fixation/metabolism regulation signal transduction histidine kinase
MTFGVVPVAALLLVLLVALHLMSSAVQYSSALNQQFIPLLLISLGGLLVLLVLVCVQLWRLVKAHRQRRAGSRLTTRMVIMFVLLALAPVGIVYYYSLQFLLRGIDSWFDVRVDQAMEDSLQLSQMALDLHKLDLLRRTEQVADQIYDSSDTALLLEVATLRAVSGATELSVLNPNGQVIASSNVNPVILVPSRPDPEIMQQLQAGSSYIGLAPLGEEGLHVRVVVPARGTRRLIVQALFLLPDRINLLSDHVHGAYSRYKELAYLREALKISFTLTLSLVLLLSFFGAVWAAFVSARRLTAPVKAIAEGTRAVASGDYEMQLPVPRRVKDELGFLVSSFNLMTRRIAQARDQAAMSQRQVEAQRSYLETVLRRLSSGVMVFDEDRVLRTANHAAQQILNLDVSPFLGRPIERLQQASPQMEHLVDSLMRPLSAPDQDWREEITLFGPDGRQVLMCRVARMSAEEGENGGHVLVFDDITALIRAQRDAAWGEVARRLAHEIKNPLTPIQLSAERLRHKYLNKLGAEDGAVLDRATATIVNQVEAMKEMVNAFSEYAKPPQMKPEPLLADKLVGEILDLYQDGDTRLRLIRELGAGDARIEADPVRLRQVVHNLIKNAQEALAESEGGAIHVRTKLFMQPDCRMFELQVTDNGPGFDPELLGRVFEPYVTNKVKGTGLGLAVVKKIVEEHGGMIWAENLENGGGCVRLQLPLLGTEGNENPCYTQAQTDRRSYMA